MGEPLEIRELVSLEDATRASALIDRIWGEDHIVRPALLRALATHGGEVLGAFRGEEMVGTQVAFVGAGPDGLLLHSHITGVDPEAQGQGVGHALKVAQRRWCLDRGINVVTWTFDPLVARNARFNLHRLGAVAVEFHRDFYGEMVDRFNAGDRSDRLEVRWDVRSERADAALGPGLPEPSAEGAAILLGPDLDPGPGAFELDTSRALVQVPSDYHGLRRQDPEAASRWRTAVGDALEDALRSGWRATGFSRSSAYLLERV